MAAVLLLPLVQGCSSDKVTTPTEPQVQSVVLAPGAGALTVGESVQLQPVVTGVSGGTLTLRVAFASSRPAVAAVSSAGLVSALSAGQTTITAEAGGKSASVLITVLEENPRNFRIAAVQFTQGVQAADGSIPMVLGGNAAAVNVVVAASRLGNPSPMQVVLRLYNATGELLRSDTATTGTTLVVQPDLYAPTVQFLVPASVLQAGLRYQVVRDPLHRTPDVDATDDIFPATGLALVNTVQLPPLKVKLFPVRLLHHNGTTPALTAAMLPDFTRTLLSVHPLSEVSVTIGTTISTDADFGTAPRGGELSFWTQVLQDIDLARTLGETDRAVYWMGVVVPPAGFNYTAFGGIGYMPVSGAALGAGARASALVGPGWFSNTSQSRNLMAHELGHNFGRRHAPCGNAGSPDPLFPNPSGTIDTPGFDVYSWATGRAPLAAPVDLSTGDVMGYCDRVWASTYTYRGALQFRASTTAIAAVSPAPERVMIVRGAITAERAVVVEPVFATTAVATRPERDGPFTVELLDSRDRSLFAASFTPAVPDHAEWLGQFTFALPVSAAMEQAVATVRVTGPGRAAALRQGATSAGALRIDTQGSGRQFTMERRSADLASFECDGRHAAGVLVQHGATGALLGVAARARMNVAVPAGTPVLVVCSDGVQSVSGRAVSP